MTQVVRSRCSAASATGSFGNIFVGDEWVGLAIMSKVGEIVVMDHNRVTLDLLIQWRIFSLVPGPMRLDHVFDFDRFKLGPPSPSFKLKFPSQYSETTVLENGTRSFTRAVSVPNSYVLFQIPSPLFHSGRSRISIRETARQTLRDSRRQGSTECLWISRGSRSTDRVVRLAPLVSLCRSGINILLPSVHGRQSRRRRTCTTASTSSFLAKTSITLYAQSNCLAFLTEMKHLFSGCFPSIYVCFHENA